VCEAPRRWIGNATNLDCYAAVLRMCHSSAPFLRDPRVAVRPLLSAHLSICLCKGCLRGTHRGMGARPDLLRRPLHALVGPWSLSVMTPTRVGCRRTRVSETEVLTTLDVPAYPVACGRSRDAGTLGRTAVLGEAGEREADAGGSVRLGLGSATDAGRDLELRPHRQTRATSPAPSLPMRRGRSKRLAAGEGRRSRPQELAETTGSFRRHTS
jgi:hypothetical protein